MLEALPGRGRITRVTLRTASPDAEIPAVEARVIPRPSHRGTPEGEFDTENQYDAFPEPTRLAETVDVVLPHGHHRDSTGLVLTFKDAEAARAFGRAAYRAAVILGTTMPFGAGTVAETAPAAIDELPTEVAHAGGL
jgi:hypothetical protein